MFSKLLILVVLVFKRLLKGVKILRWLIFFWVEVMLVLVDLILVCVFFRLDRVEEMFVFVV